MLRGARQVGKSALVRHLAATMGLQLAEVNFELQPALDKVFATESSQKLIPRLQEALNLRIDSKTLLFLDEIQLSENAFASLRVLYEQHPEIPVIAAGSLLEFSLADFQNAFPVGRVTFRWIGPLSFKEYLCARKCEIYLSSIADFVSGKTRDISPEAHEKLLSELARFIYVGGMPEAMRRSLADESWEVVAASSAEAHSDILLSYRSDFYKYRGKLPVESLQAVLDAVPRIAALSKVKYANINRELRSASLRAALIALEKAGVVRRVMATHANGIPLASGVKEDFFKILPLDIGLFVSQTFGGSRAGRPVVDLFQKWTQGNLYEQKWLGQVAEIFVGQSIQHEVHSAQPLFFWLRESKGAQAEIDFVVQFGSNIIPIEVKAGASGTLRSLHTFMGEKMLPLAIRFDLNRPSVQDIDIDVPISGGTMRKAKYRLLNLPLYLASWLPEIVTNLREDRGIAG